MASSSTRFWRGSASPASIPSGRGSSRRIHSSGHNLHTILGVVDTVRSFDILAPVQGMVYAMATEFEELAGLLD